ncbi:MAG: hypothetical protein QXG03_00325 [Halalkalicoccus sp.]
MLIWKATQLEIPNVATGAAVESSRYASFSRDMFISSAMSFIEEPTIAVFA